ncbi:MAG: FxLYD domain-containing protein [Erysipelotrichaceae bacterium]|nr:FxLYD domain-containing protein [Erysipelotrichaceae bacterium]
MKHINILLILLLIVSLGACSSETNTSSTSVESSTSSSDPAPAKEEFTYEISNVQEKIEENPYWGTSFDVVVEITNTGNVPIYMHKCVLDYEDNDGHLLQTYDFMSKVPDVVEPGDKGYFYGKSYFDEGVDFSNGSVLKPKVSIEKAKGTLTSYPVEDVSLYNDYNAVGCKGRIINETDEEVSYIYLTVVYYGSDGEILGITGTSVTDILPNDKTSFDCSGLMLSGFTVDDVVDYRIYCDEMYMQF